MDTSTDKNVKADSAVIPEATGEPEKKKTSRKSTPVSVVVPTATKVDKVKPQAAGAKQTAMPSHETALKHHSLDHICGTFESAEYPYQSKMKKPRYEKRKAELQVELLKVQKWVKDTKQRIVIVFEGRDAAGKGGIIQPFNEHLNPRSARVVALEKPSKAERTQWYFQRYVQHLPAAGEIVFLDRSWYNRAGVERVMGFCEPSEYREFMRQCPDLERMLVRSGIRLFKYWFSVTQEEQRRRFESRESDPLNQWKISPIDIESLDKWDEYTEAKEDMFFYTDTADAPWTVIKANDKRRACLNAMRHCLSNLPYPDKSKKILESIDPLIVGSAPM